MRALLKQHDRRPSLCKLRGDDGAPRTLGPGESVTVAVTFRPTASGERSGTLAVTHTGSNTPLRVPLAGTATASGSETVLYRVNSGGAPVAGGPGTGGRSDTSAAPPAIASTSPAAPTNRCSSPAPAPASPPGRSCPATR